MEVDDLLPLSGLQHLIYCERQFALIHVERAWAENELTVSGRQLHERVDLPGTARGADVRVARALPLRCDRLGLAGKADVVEFRREAGPDGGTLWRPFPVEYKRGRPRPGGADEVQLCAQALCLEEMLGLEVPRGALFYGRTRRRRPVDFDDRLRARVEAAARRGRELLDAGVTPRADRDRRCDRCSLLDICQPGVAAAPGRAADPFDPSRLATLPEDPP